MHLFEIVGPVEIPCDTGKAGRAIAFDKLAHFWAKSKNIAGRRGCYVFAVRAGKGYTPVYVGRATRSFHPECFTYHKLNYYHRCLIDYSRGTPVMFFVVSPRARGRANASVIGEVEKYLIALAETANPNLSNVQGRTKEWWGIRGVVRGGKGKPSIDVREFRRLMKT